MEKEPKPPQSIRPTAATPPRFESKALRDFSAAAFAVACENRTLSRHLFHAERTVDRAEQNLRAVKGQLAAARGQITKLKKRLAELER